MAFSPLIASLLGNQSPFTPGINPNAPNPQQQQPSNPLMQFLNKPGGSFLMNLLAQQGFSKTPQSPFAAIGRAGLATQAQSAAQAQSELQRKLIESQIGLNTAKASLGGNPTAGNVAKTFEGDNGNMWIIRQDGKAQDTGVPFSNNLQLVEQADGSVVAVDRRTGQVVGSPVTPQQASEATRRKTQTEKQQKLPTELAALDSVIGKADATIDKTQEVKPLVTPANVGIESTLRGDLPGFLGGDPRKLKQAVKSLQANFGFDTLQQMRQASKSGGALGQVSERELDLLINALRSIDLEGDPETLQTNLDAVIKHYENYKREIEKMKSALQKEAGVESAQNNVIDFEDL